MVCRISALQVMAISSALLSASAPVALADRLEMRLFGHEITVLGQSPELLSIDGNSVHEDEHIYLKEFLLISGVPVVIGASAPGGNMCDASPFVLSFPPGKAPRVDGPVKSCAIVRWRQDGETLLFETDAQPGEVGEKWTWTLNGFAPSVETQFAPDPGRGWSELRERTIQHPSEIMAYGEVAAAIGELVVDDDLPLYLETLKLGSVKFDGDWFIGTGCVPHFCRFIASLTVADISGRSVYVAWKPDQKPIVVKPRVELWPHIARHALAKWARAWK